MSNHQKIKDEILPGDILLSCHKRHPISKVISGITRSNWSHTFLYIGDNKIIESDWDGVVIKPLDHYLNDTYRVGLFRVTPELTEEESKQVIVEARKMLGIHYGFWQLIWQFILRVCCKSEDPDWALNVDSGVICSEMVAKAYKKIGKKFKNLPPHQMEPVDFDDSPITVRIA